MGTRPPKPFPKGVSGNPGGAPKGKRISTWMVELGQMEVLPDPHTLPVNGRIALARIQKAMLLSGDRAVEILLDRTEGSVKQVHELRDKRRPMSAEDIEARWGHRQDRPKG